MLYVYLCVCALVLITPSAFSLEGLFFRALQTCVAQLPTTWSCWFVTNLGLTTTNLTRVKSTSYRGAKPCKTLLSQMQPFVEFPGLMMSNGDSVLFSGLWIRQAPCHHLLSGCQPVWPESNGWLLMPQTAWSITLGTNFHQWFLLRLMVDQ